MHVLLARDSGPRAGARSSTPLKEPSSTPPMSDRPAPMLRNLFTLGFVVACVASAAGCGATTPPAPLEEPTGGPTSVTSATTPRRWALTPAAPATLVRTACVPDGPEPCDAVDSDCDGVIDEGCGFDTGVLQVTATWNRPIDLDLIIEGPRVQMAEATDHDGEGACTDEATHTSRLENARLLDPVTGSYDLAVQWDPDCPTAETGDGPVQVSVSVAAAGEVLGVYNLAVQARGDRVAVATLDAE